MPGNQQLVQAVRAMWVGVRMTCMYNGKQRYGVVRFVKQGPVIRQADGEFFFMNMPDGPVYVDFHQSNGGVRCFAWSRVVNPRLWSPSKESPVAIDYMVDAIRVARPRPIEPVE